MVTVLVLLSSPLILAQSDDESGGGIGPDNIFWGLDKAFEKLGLALTFNDHSKALKVLEIVKERRLEAQSMIKKEKPEHAEKAMKEWKKNIDRAEKERKELEEKGKTAEAEEIEKGIENAITVLQGIVERFQNDDNPNNDNALKGLNNALESLDENLKKQKEVKVGVEEIENFDGEAEDTTTTDSDDLKNTENIIDSTTESTDGTKDTVKETTEETEIKTFILTGENFKFVMNGVSNPDIIVQQGDKVRIEFKSTSGNHDWTVDEFSSSTDVVQSGDSTFVEFVADQAGTFEYYCSVGNHRSQGMKGNLVVK